MSNFKVNGNEIPEPNSFVVTYNKIQKKQRLANGRMVKDTIAIKNVFELNYPFIEYVDLEPIITAFELAAEFFVLTYEHEGSTQTATVEISDLSTQLLHTHTDTDKWLYNNLRIVLEEQ